MTAFDEDRLYGGNPAYAPGLSWNGIYPRWKCPRRYLDAGYPHKSIKLDPPGSADDEHHEARARQCRKHTIDLLRWWKAQDASEENHGTWAWAIARYRTDRFSPYRDTKQNTQKGYDYCLDRWLGIIGHMRIEDLDWSAVKSIEAAMRDKGYDAGHVRRLMVMLRMVAKYAGFALKNAAARETSAVLSNMRFRGAAPRSVAPTREQIEAIVAHADQAGDHAIAAGLLLQFELALRAVDVRGQWFQIDAREFAQSGVVRKTERNGVAHYSRWQDGLTWEMFAPDLTSFTKVISKTERVEPEPYVFDLSPLPDLRERLHRLRERRATGPVIVSDRFGLPYDSTSWAAAFRRHRDAAGVPAEVKAMDLRAGAITEAKGMGADPYALRDAAQHRQITTTDRYSRDRSAGINKVVQLRQNRERG